MAISMVGTPVSQELASGSSFTINLPGSLQEGDVVYFCAGNPNGANPDIAINDAGWTELADLYADDTTDANMIVGRKIMGASPDTTVTVSQGAGNAWTAIAVAYRGVDQTTPEDATPTTATGINSPDPDPPSITTVTANAVVAVFGSSSESTGTVTFPSGYGNTKDEPHSSAATRQVFADKLVVSPGVENAAIFDVSAGTTADSWAAISIAIRPAAGAGAVLNANPFAILGVGRKLP